MTRTAAPKVPGEITAVEPETVAGQAVEVAKTTEQSEVLKDSPAAAETVMVEKVQLEELLSTVAELSSKVQSMESEKRASRPMVEKVELPSSSSIDPTAITSPVLTKEGWVVPEKFGSNPNAPKAF